MTVNASSSGSSVSPSPSPHRFKPASLSVARRQITHHWLRKTMPVAIALTVLPLVALGGLTFGVGRSLLSSVPAQGQSSEPQSLQSQAQRWLWILLLSTGATAVLAGGLSWLWLKVCLNALVKQSLQVDQSELSESLQDLGLTIGLMQDQTNVPDILEIAASEVRSLLKVDRVLVLELSKAGQMTPQAESCHLPQSDWMHLSADQLEVPLSELFKVPMGYVQVCSEVSGSDLPKPHQEMLLRLNVQAQMVTPISLNHQRQGVLVVQSATPRDWTKVEHQLFAAIAKQIGLAVERQTSVGQGTTTAQLSGQETLWRDYFDHGVQWVKSGREQAQKLQNTRTQLQAANDWAEGVAKGVQQTQHHGQSLEQQLHLTETAVGRSMSSMTELQQTVVQTQVRSEQVIEQAQKIGQLTNQVKAIAEQLNYQSMNASIAAKKQATSDQAWNLEFTNQILQMTRELMRQTQEMATLTTQTVTEGHAIYQGIDTSQEQLLVTTEWLRESRQHLNQVMALQVQWETSLHHLHESQQQQWGQTQSAQQHISDLSHWLNQTLEQTESMVRMMESATQRALA